jgi:hypothetical protein
MHAKIADGALDFGMARHYLNGAECRLPADSNIEKSSVARPPVLIEPEAYRRHRAFECALRASTRPS